MNVGKMVYFGFGWNYDYLVGWLTRLTRRDEMAETNLTPLEQTVLDACWDAAMASTGGDFACLDEVSVKGLGRKALGGVVTSLETKQMISVDVSFVNGGWNGKRMTKGDRIVQITFPDEFRASKR